MFKNMYKNSYETILPISSSFFDWMKNIQLNVEINLDNYLSSSNLSSMVAKPLYEVMRYSVLGGGKKIRPLLVYASGEIFCASEELLTRAAIAVEFIHAYSLIHDDMPSMDNAVLRRGKISVHVKYGESMALLAGDALQTQAFFVLANNSTHSEQFAQQLKMIAVLAHAIGAEGMCAGQVLDLIQSDALVSISLDELENMHQLKTGALLRASVLLGAYSGKLLSTAEVMALKVYSNAIGLAFQIVDDILDATADSSILGKIVGQDVVNQRQTYMSVLGLEKSKALVNKLCFDAHNALIIFNSCANRLHDLADFIVQRQT